MENKKNIAFQIAAKYHDNLMLAVMNYMASSGQQDRSGEECRDEMLLFLPGYRHPVNDPFVERMIFIDPQGPSFRGSAFHVPLFVDQMKSLGVEGELLAEIEQHTIEAERCKLERIEFNNKAEHLERLFDEAEIAFRDKSLTRSTQKNARVVQTLGLSTGKPAKRFDADKAWETYVIELVRKQGLSREDAANKIKEQFGYASYDATVKRLRDNWNALKTKWKTTAPDSLPSVMRYLAKLVPGRIPSGN